MVTGAPTPAADGSGAALADAEASACGFAASCFAASFRWQAGAISRVKARAARGRFVPFENNNASGVSLARSQTASPWGLTFGQPRACS